MQCESSETTDCQPVHSRMCFEQPLLQNSPTVLRRGRAFARRTTVRDWTLSCAAPSDMVTVLKTLQQSVTCFLLLMNLCLSVCSTMIYTYCNRYYLLKPVSVTIYVLVITTDNYLESLPTLTTLASSLECSTPSHINCLLLSLTLTFIVCIVYVAICQLF